MMHKHNPFVSFFKHGIEVMAQHGSADIRMTIRAERSPDPLIYNAPTDPEIAVMPGDGYTQHQASRNIVLRWHTRCNFVVCNLVAYNIYFHATCCMKIIR